MPRERGRWWAIPAEVTPEYAVSPARYEVLPRRGDCFQGPGTLENQFNRHLWYKFNWAAVGCATLALVTGTNLTHPIEIHKSGPDLWTMMYWVATTDEGRESCVVEGTWDYGCEGARTWSDVLNYNKTILSWPALVIVVILVCAIGWNVVSLVHDFNHLYSKIN